MASIPLPLVGAALLAALVVAIARCLLLLLERGRLLLRIEALETATSAAGAGQRGVDGLPDGSVLNDFALPRLDGGYATLSQWRGRSVLLCFVNPDCAGSRRLLAELASGRDDDPEAARALIVVSTGSVEANRRLAAATGIRAPISLQEDWEVGALCRIDRTPAAYRLDASGRTEGDVAVGARAAFTAAGHEPPIHLAAIDDPALDQLTPAPEVASPDRAGLLPGAVAPDVRLPFLDGDEIALSRLRGRPVLLVFWEPRCPACDGLLAPLALAQARQPDAWVALIGRGDPAALRQAAADAALPVVVQTQRDLSRAFATFATPAAYLLDRNGVVAAEAAIGAAAVRRLAARLAAEEMPARMSDSGPVAAAIGARRSLA